MRWEVRDMVVAAVAKILLDRGMPRAHVAAMAEAVHVWPGEHFDTLKKLWVIAIFPDEDVARRIVELGCEALDLGCDDAGLPVLREPIPEHAELRAELAAHLKRRAFAEGMKRYTARPRDPRDVRLMMVTEGELLDALRVNDPDAILFSLATVVEHCQRTVMSLSRSHPVSKGKNRP